MAQEIKSWNNGIVEDQSGSTLPTVNADDNGKTLQVVDGQWDKGGKIPDPQLPAPTVGDIGKIVGAVSDGESGAEYGLIDAPSEIYRFSASYDKTTLQWTFEPGEETRLFNAYSAGKTIIGSFSGLSDYNDMGGTLNIPLQIVLDGATASFAGYYFSSISFKSSDVYAIGVYVMAMPMNVSGTLTAIKLATQN